MSFSLDEHASRVLREYYLSSYPRRWIAAEEARPLWLLSTGKSATTTICRLLNLSPGVAAYHEEAPRLWHLGQDVWDAPDDRQWARLLWAAKRDLISNVEEDGRIYAGLNHRLSHWAHIVKQTMPRARFIVLYRDMDGFVRSAARWGWFQASDRNIEGRVRPPSGTVSDVREAIAWYWVELNRYVANFLETIPEEDHYVLPFDSIKEHDIQAVRGLYQWAGVEIPDDVSIEHVLEKKINASHVGIEVPKVWGAFDEEAAKVVGRLQRKVRP